jgi:hypothetical protein
MSEEQFVKFYEQWLPTKPDLEKQLNGIGNDQAQFASTAVKLGTSNGFKFEKTDVEKVMRASQAKYMKDHELSEKDLADAVGGAAALGGAFSINISKISSPLNLGAKVSDYGMCCW